MTAVVTDVEVLMKFQIVDHRLAFRTFVPESFWHVFTAVVVAESWFAENAHVCDVNRMNQPLGNRRLMSQRLTSGCVSDNHVLRREFR